MNTSKLRASKINPDDPNQDYQVQQMNWEYNEDPYSDSAESIKLAKQAFGKRDSRFIRQDTTKTSRTVNKANSIYQFANQANFDKTKSGEQKIYDSWPLQYERYIQYQSQSENSQDEQIEIDFPQCQDILDIIDNDDQRGRMFFIVKIISPRDQKVNVFLKKVRGSDKQIPQIEPVEKKDAYFLYSLTTISKIKQFTINIQCGATLITSKIYNYALERIQYDIGLSYDFVKGEKLQMNSFQGLIIASTFNVVQQIDFFAKSVYEFQDQRKISVYLRQSNNFDQIFDNFIKNQKNVEKILTLLHLIIKSPLNKDQKFIHYGNQTVQKIANHFVRIMVNYNLKISQQKNITLNKAQNFIETFLQIISLEKITERDFNLLTNIEQAKLNLKVAELIEFLIQNKKFDIVQKYIEIEIEFKLKILCQNKGLNSLLEIIQQSAIAFDETYVNLVTSFIYYFLKNEILKPVNLLEIIITAFGNKRFSWTEYFQQNQRFAQQNAKRLQKPPNIKQFDKFIATKIQIPNTNKKHQKFQQFYKLVRQLKKQQYLSALFQDRNISTIIGQFAQAIQAQIPQIEQVQPLQKTLKTLLDYLLSNADQKMQILLKQNSNQSTIDREIRLNQVQRLCTRILNASSKKIILSKKFMIVHKNILNIFLKNGKYFDITKSLCTCIAETIIVKLNFKQTTEVINECYDPNIFSNHMVQDLYQTNFLKQIYKQHFKNENESDIQNGRGDFINWHNFFNYKPFMNTFLVENVTRLISHKYNANKRQKNNALKVLKNLIDKGNCLEQEKNNLKSIVQIDQFELGQNTLLMILSEKRTQLIILRKILEETNSQQKVTLNSHISQFIRKVKCQQFPYKLLVKIDNANPYEKNIIRKIFSQFDIVNEIRNKVQQGSQCFQKLDKYRYFLNCLNKQYEIIDCKDIVEDLQKAQQKVRGIELNHRRFIQNILSKVDDKVLKCYNFSSFFQGENAKNIVFSQAIQKCNYLQKRIIQNRDKIIKQYQNNQLTYGSVDFFKSQLSRQKQLRQLFLMNINQEQENIGDANMVKQLLKIFSLVQKVPQIYQATKALIFYLQIDSVNKLVNTKQGFNKFELYLATVVSKQPEANISKLFEEYDQANKILGTFKFDKNQPLNFQNQRTLQLLKFLSQMSTINENQINILKQIKPELDNMKEKCDQDEQNFLVNFEELQQAEIMINYNQKIYEKEKTNIKHLISQTGKFFIQSPKIKYSSLIFQKTKQLKKEFANINQGDKKMVDKIKQILYKSTVQLIFDQQTNLSVTLLHQENQDNKMKQGKVAKTKFNEQQIERYKNQVMMYLAQQNDKKTNKQQEEKVSCYKNFIQLIKIIDQIKLVWQELQQSGYILFRHQSGQNVIEFSQTGDLVLRQKQGKSTQDTQIKINHSNYKSLSDYLKNKRAQCLDWISGIKNLQLISPKATLLQGLAVKDFYEVLTGRYPRKIVNFLAICQPDIIESYKKQKKPQFKKNHKIAIKVIEDFFQFYNRKVAQSTILLLDYGESYIKTALLNQKQKDFMNGIIELDPARLKTLDTTKILICTDGTTRIDVKSFIQTALRDDKNEYIIMRPEKLSNRNQQYIIKRIKQQQQNQKQTKMTLKMCLVTNSTIESLYQFLINNFKKKPNTSTKVEKEAAYKQFIDERIKDLLIVKSAQPGFGKTTYILKKCDQDKSKHIFFPLTGCPTSQSIYNQFSQMCRQIYTTNQKNQKCSLIVQIHNIDKNHYQIVNTFLQQLITSRCIRYDGRFPKLWASTKLYIEIQNIQGVQKFDPLVTFTYLKQLVQRKGNLILKNIQTRPPIDFSLKDKKKLEYIVEHLDVYSRGGLDVEKNIKINRFTQFVAKGINQARATQLFNQYFFSLMRNATFYQFQYFCNLLFQGCQSFSSSYALSVENLADSFKNILYRTKLAIGTLRSEFFKVILQNCRDFIGRQVDYKQFSEEPSETQQKLRQIPFLLIPNVDGQSFSYIYKDHLKVPEAIRNFYISQSYDLLTQINTVKLEDLFYKHSIKRLEKEEPQKFNQTISDILMNISGNKDYSRNREQDQNYVVNIDNFFKMCLITLRERQKIPIIIMGEAGIGKTAILRHVSNTLYQHQFLTLNINAGTKIQDLKIFLELVEKKYDEIKANRGKKLWVFFDQFNTLKQVGYIKQIIVDKRFQGKQLKFLKQVILMAACNPFRKLNDRQNNQHLLSAIHLQPQIPNQEQQKKQKLAFHVLPPPHSMIECMWNYGALSPYEYEKYIQKMIQSVNYKRSQSTKALLQIHKYLAKQFDSSYVSLRDIQRFRTMYSFFNQKLPLVAHKNTATYLGYQNRQERALIMSFVFCYILRLDNIKFKKAIYKIMEIKEHLNLQSGYIEKIKQVEETDFYHRLKVDFSAIAANSAIKQNTYCFFVAIYNKLPMIIVGPPGCSKSLSIRILIQNMKGANSLDKYLKQFQAIRALNFQGSQICTSTQVQDLFKKATKKPNDNQAHSSSIIVVVFDEIGLADKSLDNPLKVIHPYLQVSKDLNLGNQANNERNYAFLGISNSNLDISKMSRMLVLRRAQPTQKQLKDTAVGIGRSFQYGQNQKISGIVQCLSESFFIFLTEWNKKRIFKDFYSLRDFYSLIKYFLITCSQKKVNVNDDRQISQLIDNAVYKNLNGMNDSINLFMQSYCTVTHKLYEEQKKENNTVESIMKCLEKQNLRFPLVIVEDQQSLSYLINLLINKFEKKTAYFEQSPFAKDKNNSQHVIQTTGSIIKTLQKGQKLILNNIQKTIQTSLYDMLNKFYIVRGNENYCRISNIETGLVKKILVNKQFNCIFFLLKTNLQATQAPFLSRFEKYNFSLEKAQNFKKVEEMSRQVQDFKSKIIQICKNKNLGHYKIENFFQNCQKNNLKTLILRSLNELTMRKQQKINQIDSVNKIDSMSKIDSFSKIQQTSIKQNTNVNIDKLVMSQVIHEITMNSTQDFAMIYKYVLYQEPELQQYGDAINDAIQKKKTFDIKNANDVIIFTTDKDIIFNPEQKNLTKHVVLEHIKQQIAFDETVRQFLNDKQNIYLFFELKTKDSKIIQYLISQILKVKSQQELSKQKNYQNKKMFMLFQLRRKQQQFKNKTNLNQSTVKGISFLNQYRQIFYDGKMQLGQIKYDKKDFFSNILKIGCILEHIESFFTVQFKCKNDDNKSQLLKSYKKLFKQLENSQNILHRHIEEFIQKTEGTNISINQAVVLDVLQNPQAIKNCNSFKEALTKQLSKKHYYGVVAYFIKYLFEHQVLLSYSRDEIYRFNEVQHFSFRTQRQRWINQARNSNVYKETLNAIITKKIQFLKTKYPEIKKLKRLPSKQRITNVQIERPRVFHFSKAQNQFILSKEDDCLGKLAYKIVNNGKIQKEFKQFKQQLYGKSNFILKCDKDGKQSEQNLYSYINKDQKVKQLFVFELLLDFSQKRGINIAYIETYVTILKLFVNFTLDLQYIILALLAFQQILTQIFKLFSILYENNVNIHPAPNFFQTQRIKDVKQIKNQKITLFVTNLINQFFQPIFTQFVNIKSMGGSKLFYEIFTNCMIQIQNLQKIVKDLKIPQTLVSLKDLSSFLSQFNDEHKYELLESYIKTLNKTAIYSTMFTFVQNLALKANPNQILLITKFQANKIFLQWFIQKPGDQKCLTDFIKKCQVDSNFCHNSMHVINYLLKQRNIDYSKIDNVKDQMRQVQPQLIKIAKHSKSQNFKNNLCILMVNIFYQKISQANLDKTHEQIIQSHKELFIENFNVLNANDLQSQLFQIFLFAYVKFVLQSFAELASRDKIDNQISALLNIQTDLARNCRLYCLKVLRKSNTAKIIKERFISIRKFHWTQKVSECFKQNQARSIIVPKDFCSKQLEEILTQIQSSDGSAFNLFQAMIGHATTFQNIFSILNFFMRFYYSLTYNHKVYKSQTINHFTSIKAKFEEKLGKIQTQLISRYLNHNVSPHFSTKQAEGVNQDDFISLNFLNLFIASKKSVSPLHSLFFQNGQFTQNVFNLINDQFVLSGPENPFINIAESVIQLTRNNNIGVYICCSECDYIYSHQNCGWPNQQVDCPMCGQKIGCKDRGHTLSRDDKGARRLMSKVFVDKSVFYVWSMTALTEFWQTQRKYIEAQINRMKLKKQTTIKIKKQVCKLTGLNIVNSGRLSSLSFKLVSFFVDAISYFLVSLKIINVEQIDKLFGLKTQQQALNKFNNSMKGLITQSKASLNLGNKFYGWIFGIQRNYIVQMNDFPTHFKKHQQSLNEECAKLKVKLNIQIQQKKIKQDYINLYIDFVKAIDEGYFTKQVTAVNQYTAQNRFTRDYSEKMFQQLIKLYSGDKKFEFSTKYQTNQGQMQFPFDTFLTEDQIDQNTYNYSRIFKLPDQPIRYHQITNKYQAFIKEKYPYLDFILKQSDQFMQMKNFYNVVSFVNELHKQVNNQYERTKGQAPLGKFLQILKEDKGLSLSKKLQKPQIMLQSWKRLASFLGVLQNECKIIGKMNDDYNLSTQLKAFLLDQSTKQNPYGLMIASLFHNFAKMHNQSMAVLNSRKNQIKAYSSLNLFNDLLKVHPQQIQENNLFAIDQAEFKDKLQECSVASITYGQNFIFHNFDAYQEHFLRKLQGKCQIISILKQFKSVIYNGEAFSAQTEGSAVLGSIRMVLDQKLSEQSAKAVQKYILSWKKDSQFENKIVCIRGDLQKIMLTLNTLKGNYQKESTLGEIVKQVKIHVKSVQVKTQEFSQISVLQIFDLYETLENELKHSVLRKLPEKYKAKMEEDLAKSVQQYLNMLEPQENDTMPTVQELQSAVFKFVSRTLQNGIFDAQKILVQFVINREDFWPKEYPDDKKYMLTYDPNMVQIQIAHVMNLLQIIEKVKSSRH